MSVAGGPELSDSELAAPTFPDTEARPGHRAAGAVNARAERDPLDGDPDLDDEVVRTGTRPGPSRAVLLLGAILVAMLANLVMAWLLLGTANQVRDGYAVANGLQRCLIRAQLAENSTTDPGGTAYKAAVQACIAR